MAVQRPIALKPIRVVLSILLLLIFSEIAFASTQWTEVMNLPIPASGVYESVQVASNGPETMLMYTDRINLYYATSTDGGLTFNSFRTVFPYVASGQRIYSMKLAAATSNAMRGRYMMCFIASGVPYYVEYRDGGWYNQTQLSPRPTVPSLGLAEATACTAAEAKELTWLAVTQFLDVNTMHAELFFTQRSMANTTSNAWATYTWDQDMPNYVVWPNYLNLRETPASCATCTYQGNCFYMFTTPQTPVPQDTEYNIGRNNFYGNYDNGGKTVIQYPNNIGHGLSVVIDDNVTATYAMLFNSDTATWELKCVYDTLSNMESNYNLYNPRTLPGYMCPSYSIANQGTMTTEWRFFVKAVNHYQAGAMVVSVNSIRVKNNTVMYRENVVFVSLDGWKTFTKQYVAMDMTYTAKYVTSSVTVSNNSFIMIISGQDQARVFRRPHNLGGLGITTHSAFSPSPTMSPSLTPTIAHPTVMPTSRSPSAVTSHPTTVGETSVPSSAPSGGTTGSTGAATDGPSGGLSPTATSILAAAGATLGVIAIVGVANAIVYVSKFGDDMHKFSQQGSSTTLENKTGNGPAGIDAQQQQTVAPFTV